MNRKPSQTILALLYGIGAYVAYQIVALLTIQGFRLFGVKLEVAWFLGQMIAVMAVFGGVTTLMRARLNQGRVTDERFLDLIHSSFVQAELRPPTLIVLKPENESAQNAMVSGYLAGTGLFRPSLLVTEKLHEVLDESELRAVLAHEIAHLKLYHLLHRASTTIVGTVIGAFLIGASLFGFSAVRLPGALVTYLSAGVLLVWLFVFSVAQKRQVRRQEFEADAYAVTSLDAEPRAILSAIQKLTRMSGLERIEQALERHPTRGFKGFLADLFLRGTHPSLKEREAALRLVAPEAFASTAIDSQKAA